MGRGSISNAGGGQEECAAGSDSVCEEARGGRPRVGAEEETGGMETRGDMGGVSGGQVDLTTGWMRGLGGRGGPEVPREQLRRWNRLQS